MLSPKLITCRCDKEVRLYPQCVGKLHHLSLQRQDFADGEDKIGLAGGLTFGQLTIGSSNGNTLISKNGGEVLAILADVNSSLITQADFISLM